MVDSILYIMTFVGHIVFLENSSFILNDFDLLHFIKIWSMKNLNFNYIFIYIFRVLDFKPGLGQQMK